MRILFIGLLAAFHALAQTPAAPLAQISSVVGVGASYAPKASPKTTGWLLYAQKVGSSGTFSYSAVDVVYQKQKLPSTSLETGAAQFMRPIYGMNLYALAAAGAASTGQSITGSFSGGAMLAWSSKSRHFTVLVPLRIIKVSSNATQYSIGLGFGYDQ